MDESDGAVVVRAQSGDGDAFRLLVERHSRSVFRLGYRITGNEQDAEDVVQETFLRAFKQLKHYESRSSFSTWLYRIASNYALDLIRGRKRRADKHDSDSEEGRSVLDDIVAPAPPQDRLMFSSQVQQRIAAAMEDLSELERSAFVLRHFEGLSIEEIGGMLGTSLNATKHSIFRAVQKLRKRLEPLVAPARG
jgi:RNA polymerase sigma-70 factor (ECF subfamily)